MQIVTVQFQYPDRSDYQTLLKVFKYSCQKYMPRAKFNEIKIDAPVNNSSRDLNFKYNSVKLRKWLQFVERCKDTIILADCDMIAIRSAYHAFKPKFDIAYTERTRIKRIPNNGGIIFIRPNQKSIKFLREMLRINDKMFKDPRFHERYRKRYAGMNQAAFGYMLENHSYELRLHKYKTIEFNAVDCDWPRIDRNTVFVHCKSRLRKMILGEKPERKEYAKAINLWKKLYKEMRAHG